MNLPQFRTYIIRPVLEALGNWSQSAENLVLGTGLQESGLEYIDQDDRSGSPGPAYGLFQMEAATYEDIWQNYLHFRPLAQKVLSFAIQRTLLHPPIEELWGNNFLAVALCRVQYLRSPQILPDRNDALGLATYWKTHYNTYLGKGTIAQALPHFKRACLL